MARVDPESYTPPAILSQNLRLAKASSMDKVSATNLKPQRPSQAEDSGIWYRTKTSIFGCVPDQVNQRMEIL